GGTPTFGYGYYSATLDTPFCGGKLIACAEEGLKHQFGEYRFSDATGGQYEGYNYFGAGVLLLLPLGLIAGLRELPAAIRRYPVLIVTLCLFGAYAVTNTAYFGMKEAWSFPLPALFDRITGTFRASGRFFWPVGYLVLFAALAALLKRRSVLAAVLVAIALPLQWADVQLLRERVIAKASAPSSGDLERWAGVIALAGKVHIYPAFGCGDADVNLYWFFQRLAAEYGKLLDTGYIARPNVDCEANRRAFDAGFIARQLYVMPAEYIANPFVVPIGFRDASSRGECVRWRIAVVCMTGSWAGFEGGRIAPLKPHAEWPAEALRTQVGKLQDGMLVPAAPGNAGFLSYGPYITLPPGRYHYAIDYSSQLDASQEAGHWDIALSGGRMIGKGPMQGTGGVPARIEGEFDSDGTKLPLEIRTFYPGSGDLRLSGIVLKKISQ
ncbi:hypothetical protein, partial [Noviherbaspirillum denitrificans]|uniref:hypothetical protein n=1 Tax=Noviherbaspirillum denitrificans TaxID=1968433 RepID=UPI00197F4A26